MDYAEMLCRRGAAFVDLFETMEDFRESNDVECCLVSFQLPFRMDLSFDEYVGSGNRSDIQIRFRFIPAISFLDDVGRRTTLDADDVALSSIDQHKQFECTQCIAAMPLWGPRLRYFDKYRSLSERGLNDAVVIPREEKGQTYSLSGSITCKMFENELSKRTIFEAAGAMRRLLRDYMAISLHEVPIPPLLFSAFSSPREELYLPLGNSPDLVEGYLNNNSGSALRPVDIESLRRASKWPARQFSTFETQILALKRLSDQGEPELALVGLMALVEWLVKNSLSDAQHEPKRGAFKLFEQARKAFQIPDEIHEKLFVAREARNQLAHERPTSKTGGYNPASQRTSAVLRDDTSTEIRRVFEDSASAAFELFRHLNGHSLLR